MGKDFYLNSVLVTIILEISCRILEIRFRYQDPNFSVIILQVMMPIKRSEYVVGVWRFVTILEKCLADQQKDLRLLRNFGSLCSKTYGLNDFSIYVANADFQYNKVRV